MSLDAEGLSRVWQICCPRKQRR